MLQKTIGKEYQNGAQRESFLKDNCDRVDNKSRFSQTQNHSRLRKSNN
jgi:hypothetical protein